MLKFDEVLNVRSLTFFAVLVITHSTLRSQESSQVPIPGPPALPLQSLASSPSPVLGPSADSQGTPRGTPASTPSPTVVYRDPKPTPEEVGDSFVAHQRYQKAIEAYSESTKQSAELWNKMGIAYQMMFDLKDATRSYEASLKINPRDARVLNNLATVYDSQKVYGKAERYYHKALKYDPHSALILRNLGSNLMSQHKYKKGADVYRAAVAIDPQILEQHTAASVQNPTSVKDRGALHYYMAKGCMSAGNSECAIRNLRLALNEGFTSAKKIAEDSVFANLRDSAAFQQLLAAQTHE